MSRKNLISVVAVNVVAAIVLFGLSSFLEPWKEKIFAQHRQEVFEQLLPGNPVFSEILYEGEDENISHIYPGENGCVVETVVNGYVDEIRLYVGVDKGGAVSGVYVADMNETWGLGRSGMTNFKFLSQFIGTKGTAEVGTDVDALSGATVTAKAITKAVNSASAYVTGADVSSGATEWGG